MFGGFFTFGQAEGYAKATIKEDTSMSSDEVLAKYNKIVDDGWNLNMVLIENGVDAYMGDIFWTTLQLNIEEVGKIILLTSVFIRLSKLFLKFYYKFIVIYQNYDIL